MSSFALIISYVNGINHQTVSQQLFYFHFLYMPLHAAQSSYSIGSKYCKSSNIKSSTISVAEGLEVHAGKQKVPELVVRILPWIRIFCNVHLFHVPHSWTGSVQMKSSMTFIRVYMCIEREKATFKSREVNV